MPDQTDYSQYGNWERITSKTGAQYYIVPGTGYVYDPFLSQAKGRPVLWVNPTAAVKEQEQAKKDAEKAQNNAAWGQVAGTAGGLAGTAGSLYLANKLWNGQGTPPVVQPQVPAGTTTPASVPTATAQTNVAGTSLGDAAAKGFAPSAANQPVQSVIKPTNVTAVGSNADGSIQMSDGSKVMPDRTVKSSTGQTIGNGAMVVGGALQAYNGYNQYQDGQKLGGAANMAGGAFNIAAGGQALANGGVGSLGGYVPYVGAAVAGAQIGQNMLDRDGASDDRAAKSQAEAQKAALLFAGPYGWAAYAALSGADAVSGGKASEKLMKVNKKLDSISDRFDFGIGKSVRSKLFHQSTKGFQQENTGKLAEKSEGDQAYLDYLGGMRAQIKDGPADKQNPFSDTKGNKYRTFDEYKNSADGLDPANLTGVYGNLEAYAPDWAKENNVPDWSKLSFDQQKQVTKLNIDQDNYASKKGEVYIKDRDKARQNYLAVIGGSQPPANGAAQPPPTQGPDMPPRMPQGIQLQPPPAQPSPNPQAVPRGGPPQNLGAAAANGFMTLPGKIPNQGQQIDPGFNGGINPAQINTMIKNPNGQIIGNAPQQPQHDPRYDAQGNWIGSPGMRNRPPGLPAKLM